MPGPTVAKGTTRTDVDPATEDDPRLSAFRPVQHRRAADEVIAILADAIRGHLYEPGDRLPSVRNLAERLDVSPTVIRQATDVLRRAGVVSIKRGPGGGIVVESTANLPRVISNIHGGTHADLRAVLELRRPLEMTTAALASERAADEDFSRLGALVAKLEEVPQDSDAFLPTDALFHRAIAEATRNPILARSTNAVLDELLLLVSQLPIGRIEPERALVEQRRTFRALETRDPRKAERAMDRHLTALEEAMLGTSLSRSGRAKS